MSGCSSSWQGLRDLLHLLDHHSPAIKEAHVFVLLAICIVFVETARRVACAGTVAAGTAWLKAVTAWTSTERPMIAFLSGVSEQRNRRLVAAFIRGLRELDDGNWPAISRIALV